MTPADDILGNPKQFARRQFDIAQQRCGECRDYHALWPYRRLAGIANGFEADAHILQGHLREFAPERGNMLIAGAADAGLLALAVEATGPELRIDVADRCATPLAICSAYAQSRGFTIGTVQQDLPSTDLPGHYDLIFAHSILQFMPASSRAAFLRRLAAALTQNGAVVLAERLRPAGQDECRHAHYIDDTVTGLANAAIALPESEDAFRQRLASEIASRRRRLTAALEQEDLRIYLREAGFSIRSCDSHVLRRRMTAEAGGSPDLTIQIAVARVSRH